jgi:hypothetical protein
MTMLREPGHGVVPEIADGVQTEAEPGSLIAPGVTRAQRFLFGRSASVAGLHLR